MHPYCRSTVLAYYPNRRPEKGEKIIETIKMPSNILQIFENEFGKLLTDEIVITDRIIEHIKLRHNDIGENLIDVVKDVILNPDGIVHNKLKETSVIFYKRCDDRHFYNIPVQIAVISGYYTKNYIPTIHKIRNREMEKLIDNYKKYY